MRQQVIDQPLKLHRIIDRIDEQNLIQTVVECDRARTQCLKTAYRDRICFVHTADEVIFGRAFPDC